MTSLLRSLIFSFLACTVLYGNALAGEKLIVASDPTWPPLEFLDDKKNIVGFDPEFITAVAKEAGFEVEIRNIAWDGIFAGLASGSCDIVASGVTITPERQKAFDFSIPYYTVHQTVVTRIGTTYAGFPDLKGKIIGGQIGNTGIRVAEKADCGATIREYDDVGLAMQDLINERIDAVICDSPVALYYANKKEGFTEKLRIAFHTPEGESFGFVIRKGRKDLLEKLDKGIETLRANGTEQALRRKWFGE